MAKCKALTGSAVKGLSPAGTGSELKYIHMSSPDVNMNYITSLLFLDVSIEIVKLKHPSVLSLFCFFLNLVLCVYFICVYLGRPT